MVASRAMANRNEVLKQLGLDLARGGAGTAQGIVTSGAEVVSIDPTTGEALGSVRAASAAS